MRKAWLIKEPRNVAYLFEQSGFYSVIQSPVLTALRSVLLLLVFLFHRLGGRLESRSLLPMQHFNGNLEGGLYGVSLGRMFYGESMFHHYSDLSKISLCALVAILKREQVPWIDCQQETSHLSSLGASAIDLKTFLNHLTQYCTQIQIRSAIEVA